MRYEKNLMDYWDQYSILQGAKEEGREEGMEKGRKEGMEEGIEKIVKNLLATNKFSISEIANFANVSESFVRKVKKR